MLLRLTVCVTGRWADVDNAWEQEKPEARKMLVNGDESHLSSAPRMSAGGLFFDGRTGAVLRMLC